jgi:hypothetical protein
MNHGWIGDAERLEISPISMAGTTQFPQDPRISDGVRAHGSVLMVGELGL